MTSTPDRHFKLPIYIFSSFSPSSFMPVVPVFLGRLGMEMAWRTMIVARAVQLPRSVPTAQLAITDSPAT